MDKLASLPPAGSVPEYGSLSPEPTLSFGQQPTSAAKQKSLILKLIVGALILAAVVGIVTAVVKATK